MDSNITSPLDTIQPKVEVTEDSQDSNRTTRVNWNSENTLKLIETIEKDCQELWNLKHPGYKDRSLKQQKLELLADVFSTTTVEISRKIHNLRTQFNNELRKIKKRQETALGAEAGAAGGSGWEYFESLSFLKPQNFTDSNSSVDSWEMECRLICQLAQFQAEEEEQFGLAKVVKEPLVVPPPPAGTKPMRVAASAPPPLPASAHPSMWPNPPVPKIRPSTHPDECQIFGDFVASELRMLRSLESRRKLKRVIQKAILHIGEEEDMNS